MKSILEVSNLTTAFPSRDGGKPVRACDDVSFTIGEGEIVGLVGESGCGKTTLGRSIVGLERPSAGQIVFDGVPLTGLRGGALRERRRRIQYIFQDPYASLSPRQRIGEALREVLTINGVYGHAAQSARIEELLQQIGMHPDVLGRFPRELSGGQRQRIAIARALICRPRLLICDEPVSALDVSVRAQIMNLFLELQREEGMACLFIGHDLAVVRQASQRVLVMYLGRIVEEGPSGVLTAQPRHPYSQALLSAVPTADPRVERKRRRVVLSGELPSPASPPSGCRFRTRCPAAEPICAEKAPPFVSFGPAQAAACHFAGRVDIAAA